MPEIDKQLEKLPDFEENIKVLLIPTLNYYLNLNQLDVRTIKFRQKNSQAKS
jgi:hypothetical protein